jgi:hypothetical protein
VVQHLLEHRVAGEMVPPKLAGLNALRDHRSCAFIYSSKSVGEDKPLKSVFSLNEDDIVAARETEDIVQFVYRGAIRNPSYDGPYDIYLYNRDQAEAVAAAMTDFGIRNVEVLPIPGSPIMTTAGNTASSRTTINAGIAQARKKAQARLRAQRYRARKKAQKHGSAAATVAGGASQII